MTAAFMLLCAAAAAQERARPAGLDEARVEALLDTVVAEKMEAHKVPGLIITIVEGDRVVLSKGYGWAKVDGKIPVDAEKTLFRVGSLSKLVTATAFMRLTELDEQVTIDSDVRELIAPIALTLSHNAPVTPMALLTHTAGFDVTDIGDASRTLKGTIPLRDVIAGYMTPQVYPPGRYHIYTNHGFALLGYLIEVRRKMPFAQAVDKDIFGPLGMTSTSFAQPPPAALLARLAAGHDYVEGAYKTLPLDYSNVVPADGLVTTGADMGRFMIEHLRLYSAREGAKAPGLLQPESLKQMHRRHIGYHDELDGYALGFWEERLEGSGRRVLAHTGGQLGFTSKLLIVPELSLGVFICTNRRVGKMRREVVERFMEACYPAEPAQAPPSASVPGDQSRRVGDYMGVAFPSHGVEKIGALIAPEAVVAVEWDGATLRAGRFGTLTPLGNGLFYSVEKNVKVAFGEDEGGRVTDFYVDTRAYRRLSWAERPVTSQRVLVASFLLCLVGVFAWPVEGRRRRRKGGAPETTDKAAAWAKGAVWLACLMVVLFDVWLVVEIARASGEGWDYGLPVSLRALLMLPLLLIALCPVLWIRASIALRRGSWGPIGRVFYTLIAVVLITFLWVLSRWGLIEL